MDLRNACKYYCRMSRDKLACKRRCVAVGWPWHHLGLHCVNFDTNTEAVQCTYRILCDELTVTAVVTMWKFWLHIFDESFVNTFCNWAVWWSQK